MRVVAPLLLTLSLLLAGPAGAQIYYAAPGDLGDGSACDSPGTIAEALDLARMDGSGMPTEVRIAGGMYNEFNLVIDFSNVSVKGGYNPADVGAIGCDDATAETNRDPATFETVIDAMDMDRILDIVPNVMAGDPPIFVSSNTDIEVSGITFTNGRPQRMTASGDLGGSGGAILLLNCDRVTISNNVFRDNESFQHLFAGGAIYIAGYATGPTTADFHPVNVELNENVFENNRTGDPMENSSGIGGAVAAVDFNNTSMTAIRQTVINAARNTFTGNVAQGATTIPAALCDGTGNQDCQDPFDGSLDTCNSRALGGAVYFANVGGIWDENIFDGNQSLSGTVDDDPGSDAIDRNSTDASGQGGAIYSFSTTPAAQFGAHPRLTNNTFSNNLASAGLGDGDRCGFFSAWGGAAYLAYFNEEVSGNTFDSNTADGTTVAAVNQTGWGGAIFMIPDGNIASDAMVPTIDDNMFIGNGALNNTSNNGGWGGAMIAIDFRLATTPQITNNVFDSNMVTGMVGASGYGGALALQTDGPRTLLAGNTFTGNMAAADCMGICGIGGAARVVATAPAPDTAADHVIADNHFIGNSAFLLGGGTPLSHAGLVIFTGAQNDTAQKPLIQNNLIVQNEGAGLAFFGFDTMGGSGNDPTDYAFSTASLRYNTIADNMGPGVLTNLADDIEITGNIVTRNDGSMVGVGDWLDDWLCNVGAPPDCMPRPTMGATANNNLTGAIPDYAAAEFGGMNGNLVGSNPMWVDLGGPGVEDDYYLSQVPDQATDSPAKDAGHAPAIAIGLGTPTNPTGLDLDGDTNPDSLFLKTTNTGSLPDSFQADMGYHYPLTVPVMDTDMDGIPDSVEMTIPCLDPLDADVDDDGVADGLDLGGDVDMDGLEAYCDCDSDDDGLPDGLERGIDAPIPDGPGYSGTDPGGLCDTSRACGCGSVDDMSFRADTQPSTTSDFLNPDSDGGGELDGCEDTDKNGAAGAPGSGDSNPNDVDDDDPDMDGASNFAEGFIGTDPFDADTDDDGVADFDEVMPADFNDLSDPLVCDTDGDGLPDGLEHGVTMPVADPDGVACPAIGTDATAICASTGELAYIPAPTGDPNYRDTDAQAPITPRVGSGYDTDGDTCADGDEDANHNGIFEMALGETDPLDGGDCVVAISLVIAGASADASGCTTEIADALDLASGMGVCEPADFSGGACPDPRVDGVSQPWMGDTTLPGAAAMGAGDPIEFYELTMCPGSFRVSKMGDDLVLTVVP